MGMGPGGMSATALSVEAKKKMLWGKKAEPEAAKVYITFCTAVLM